jgi:hypothetical protein
LEAKEATVGTEAKVAAEADWRSKGLIEVGVTPKTNSREPTRIKTIF